MRRILLAGLACLLLCGCAYNPAETKLGGGPFGWFFRDSKDNDIEMLGLEVDPETKVITLESLIIRNNASDAARANVEQMMAFVEQQRAANEGIKLTMDGLVGIASQLTAAVSALPVNRGSTAAEPCPVTEAAETLLGPPGG